MNQVPNSKETGNFGSPTAESRALDILKQVQNNVLKQDPKAPKVVEVEPEQPVVPPVIENKVASSEKTEEPEYEINPPVQKVEAKESIPPQFIPEDPTDEIDQLIDPKDTTGANFKKLRTKLKAVTKEQKEKLAELENTKKKLQEYETGLTLPDEIAKKLGRLEELEQYEKIVNIKASPAYVENIVKPMGEEHTKLGTLAKEYNISETDVQNILNAGSTAEQNRLISSLFKDDVGAFEAKSIINSIKKIQNKAAEIEKEPAKLITAMQQESERIVREKRQKANESIANTTREAWSEALNDLRKDERFPEIAFKEGDTEHNEKFVKPILVQAGQSYGKFVKAFAEHGLEAMPKDVAVALARMCQLSHQAAVATVERDKLLRRVAELENNLNITHRVDRPSLRGSNGGTGGNSAPIGPRSLEDRALDVLNSVASIK